MDLLTYVALIVASNLLGLWAGRQDVTTYHRLAFMSGLIGLCAFVFVLAIVLKVGVGLFALEWNSAVGFFLGIGVLVTGFATLLAVGMVALIWSKRVASR